MDMHWFEKWVVNAFSGFYLRWFLLPRLLALLDGPLRGKGLALGPGVGWEALALLRSSLAITRRAGSENRSSKPGRESFPGMKCSPLQVEPVG